MPRITSSGFSDCPPRGEPVETPRPRRLPLHRISGFAEIRSSRDRDFDLSAPDMGIPGDTPTGIVSMGSAKSLLSSRERHPTGASQILPSAAYVSHIREWGV